jgi:hypothetical protein
MRDGRRYRKYEVLVKNNDWQNVPIKTRFEERIADLKKILQKGPDKHLRETLELNEYLYNGLFYTKGVK